MKPKNKFSLREIVGLIIWWTEGTKAIRDKRWKNGMQYHVDLTNTDPTLIKMFLDFLRKDIKINETRLKIQLQIHEDNNQYKTEQYWSEITNIPLIRFNKTIIRPLGNKPGKTKGTCKVRYSDKATHHKLEQYLQELITLLSSGQ